MEQGEKIIQIIKRHLKLQISLIYQMTYLNFNI